MVAENGNSQKKGKSAVEAAAVLQYYTRDSGFVHSQCEVCKRLKHEDFSLQARYPSHALDEI
jgi:hypothetical protein